jgi:pullulanase/glycogen debranching enzyme
MQSSLFIPAPFLAASNIYEVNIRQYTAEGTFNAFAKHIPRLKEMGVQILWLMPIFPIGKKNRKGTLGSYYSIADFKKISKILLP